MNNRDMITIRNKKTGEVKTIPRSQFVEKKTSKGISGVLEDVDKSLSSLPEAAYNLVASIPGGINKVGHYATTNNPVSTLANLGAGGVESLAGLASAPQMLTRYLAEKFPKFGERASQSTKEHGMGDFTDPTFYEALRKFEGEHNLAPRGEEEESVRNAGGLLFGGGVLTKLPNMLSRMGSITGEQAGRGGDPLHAAILSMLGEGTAKIPFRKTKELPQVIRKIPEFAGKKAAKGLESLAESSAKVHIPILPKKLLEKSYQLKYKSNSPEKLAKERLFSDLTEADLPQINERIAAANRLGLGYLTPAEAALSPFEAVKQGTIGRTSSGSKLLFEKGKERQSNEAKSINNLLDTIYDERTLDPKKRDAYEKTMESFVPQEFIEQWSKDPLVAHAIKELETKPVYKKALGNTPKDSFEYWDQVKRVLGDMKTSSTGRKAYEESVIDNTRRDMVAQMDEINPTYRIARNISEREFTRKDIEKFFDKRKMTGNNFYNLIKSKTKFDELMHKLQAFPEAQQQLRDMHLLFEDLIPNSQSLRASTALKRTSMSEPRNALDAERLALDEKYGQEHDVAQVNLMTNPDLLRVLTEYLKNQKGKK